MSNELMGKQQLIKVTTDKLSGTKPVSFHSETMPVKCLMKSKSPTLGDYNLVWILQRKKPLKKLWIKILIQGSLTRTVHLDKPFNFLF